jgi:hypothetical protein
MVGIKRGVEPEEVRRDARHTLFVEGSNSSIDPQALTFFLRQNGINISIVSLGPSSHLRAVAQALCQHHHDYYFLIDRDDHDDKSVEDCWSNFPNGNTHNLLIWRRREIENYFLIPDYLARSQYLSCSLEELQQCIRETASKRAYLDVANLVILKLKKKLNKDWIELFDAEKITGFDGRDTTLAKLKDTYEAAKQTCDVFQQLHEYPIFDRFNETVEKFFGGQNKLEFGHGSWLEMIKGKHILRTVINKCFRVKDATGKSLQGDERCMEVVKSLLKLPLEDQPRDFKELHKLISTRVIRPT